MRVILLFLALSMTTACSEDKYVMVKDCMTNNEAITEYIAACINNSGRSSSSQFYCKNQAQELYCISSFKPNPNFERTETY